MNLQKIPKNGKIAIIGGGISGLSFSFFLNKLRPDINITIFERQKETGGYIKSLILTNSKNKEKILLEKGPRTLRGVSDGTLLIVDMLKLLNIQDQIEITERNSLANRKFLLNSKNELVQVPNSFSSLVKFFKIGNLFRIISSIFREPFNNSTFLRVDDESIESFINRRFGDTILSDKIVSAIIHGIYAGDVSKLSVKSIFPKLVTFENENSSIISNVIKKVFYNKGNKGKNKKSEIYEPLMMYQELISPNSMLLELAKTFKNYPMIRLRDGLQSLPKSLTNYLNNKLNINIVYNSDIKHIYPIESKIETAEGQIFQFDHIRSTLNYNQLSKLLNNNSNELQKLIKLEYVDIFLCNIYTKSLDIIPKDKNGFGFLVPKFNKNPECLLGVIFDSDIEQNSKSLFEHSSEKEKDYNKITLMMGGHYFKDIGSIPSNSTNLKHVETILSSILNVDMTKYNLIVRDEINQLDKSIELNPQDLLVSYNLYKDCIPQFNVGYNKQNDMLNKYLENHLEGKFSIGGTSLGNGIGVPDCVMNSLEDALKLS